jgi:diguanylate cyclase (GGDEF)-like protein
MLKETLESLVRQRTQELLEANKKLEALALTDPLTEISNRRAIFNKFQEELERSARYQRTFSIIFVDIDNFKKYNDTLGHLEGDKILKQVAKILTTQVRKIDSVGRYGGEEFLIILPETNIQDAKEISERLKNSIQKETVVTISIGLVSNTAVGSTVEDLLSQADKALYLAKKNGRNRIEVYV